MTTTDDRAARLQHRIDDLHDRDDQFRAAEPDRTIADAARALRPNLARVVTEVMTRYADRPALGRRVDEVVTDSGGRSTRRLLPRMETVTYGEAWSDATALARELATGRDSVRAGDFVATLGFASVDYVVVELATIALGAVAVPLQAGASADHLASIADEVVPAVLATDTANLATAVEIATRTAGLRRLLVLDHDDRLSDHVDALDAARHRLRSSAIDLDTVAGAVQRGRTAPAAPGVAEDDPDRIATLVYTSGSTGTPKGAIHTDHIVSEAWTGAWHSTGATEDDATADPDLVTAPVITLDYLPMSHLAGRGLVFSTLAAGGTVYFTGSSDLSTLFDDFALARPTLALLVPRVCEMIRHSVLAEIDVRLDAGATEPDAVRREVFAHYRDTVFGGRILAAMAGTAPVATEVVEFLDELLDVHVQDNYGSTEAGMVLHDGVVQRPPVLDYKLVDVPELGYFGTDTPHPRGELLVKTRSITPGYYKRPDVTATVFDDDGFYRTGDVVAELAPDLLAYVDRRSNVLKLAQGEFVALAHLEAVFGTSEQIDQIFVYGNGERSYLLAVVVPAAGVTDTGTVAASLQRIARREGLQSYEIPREIVLEPQPFTQENGLLSGAGKQLRPKLIERYGADLEGRYLTLEEGQTDQLRELRRRGGEGPVLDTVQRAAQALLGCAGTDVSPDSHFTDLGGDSLSALTFSGLLRDIFGVDVPVGVVIGPSTDLTALAQYITRQRDGGSDTATFASVHGREATEARADELTLEAFLDATLLGDAAALPGPREVTRTVFLTGANGYLGRFLCLEWMQRMADVGGTVVCLIRGRSDDDARARLDRAFDTGDSDLLALYRRLADATLDVVSGDIGTERFGLDDATWVELTERVDRVIHPAALVNHALPYEQLFGPNVAGTAEVIRLALTDHIKPVTYLSTVAVAAGVTDFTEGGDIRESSPVRAIDQSYANGYGTSKWAGEVLLRSAFDRFALPVEVFRSDMILAHQRWAGQVNVPDVFTRLLLSVVGTGIAPTSFYRTDATGAARGHYDGLPADFTAAAITTLGGDATAGYRTFDVLNPHDDGTSLDTFVDWMIDAGRTIDRIDDYDEWFARFSAALAELPEPQRSASLLPLLRAYEHPAVPTAGSVLPADRFRAAVRRNGVHDWTDIPHLERSLIEKYLTDLAALKLISDS